MAWGLWTLRLQTNVPLWHPDPCLNQLASPSVRDHYQSACWVAWLCISKELAGVYAPDYFQGVAQAIEGNEQRNGENKEGEWSHACESLNALNEAT